MNDLDAIKSSGSASFRKRNPHIFSPASASDVEGNGGGEDDEEHEHLAALTAKGAQKKRIRQSSKSLLNGLETEWLGVLKLRYPYPSEAQITTQAIRFSLGNGIAYKADFVVFREAKRTMAYECKGPYAHRGGFENLKVAANRYPLVQFILVWKDDKGQWQEQHVLP